MVLTVNHGSNDQTSPRFKKVKLIDTISLLDLFIGPYLDKMNVVFQSLSVPRQESGQTITYDIPARFAHLIMMGHYPKYLASI